MFQQLFTVSVPCSPISIQLFILFLAHIASIVVAPGPVHPAYAERARSPIIAACRVRHATRFVRFVKQMKGNANFTRENNTTFHVMLERESAITKQHHTSQSMAYSMVSVYFAHLFTGRCFILFTASTCEHRRPYIGTILDTQPVYCLSRNTTMHPSSYCSNTSSTCFRHKDRLSFTLKYCILLNHTVGF